MAGSSGQAAPLLAGWPLLPPDAPAPLAHTNFVTNGTLRRESPWSSPVAALSRPLQRSRSSSTSQCPVLTHLSPSQNFALARRWICSSPLTGPHDDSAISYFPDMASDGLREAI